MFARVWKVRMYQKGDEIGYNKLMNLVFPGSRQDLRRWRWEFKENPFGFLEVFAECGQHIVGHMGLTFVDVKIGDKIVKGAQAVDLAVHPRFRRQGMFLEMGKTLMERARKEGVPFSYGVPNEPAYHGHLKYGWSYAGEIPVLVNFLTLQGLLKLFLARMRLSLMSGKFKQFISFAKSLAGLIPSFLSAQHEHLNPENLQIRLVLSFDTRIDDLWKDVSKDYKLAVVREKKYLNWRYVEKPDSNYVLYLAEKDHRPEGYMVLSISKPHPLKPRAGYIVDIFARSKMVFDGLIRSAIEYFHQEKADLIITWMMKYHLPYRCLVKHGFILDTLRTGILICFINTPSLELRKLYNKSRKRWYFTMGDSDAI